jgi:hypothetical protein
MRWGLRIGMLAGLVGLISCSTDRGDVAGPRQATEVAGGYTLVEERLGVSLTDLETSKLIGLEGGTVTLLGHSIQVPVGAVSSPTLFAIRLVTNGYVEVDLSALGGVGGVIDVGSAGFAVPVKLTLTYSRASNVSDPSKLVILRNLGPGYTGSYEVLPTTVNVGSKTIFASLEHFSSYVMASD